jgi:hypothetical protein
VYVSEEWIKQYLIKENKLLTNNVYVASCRYNKSLCACIRRLNVYVYVYASEEWIKQYPIRENKLLRNDVYVASCQYNKSLCARIRRLKLCMCRMNG